MQYVDREHPEASRLLTVPQAPHGTAKTAIFSDHQVTQYRRLLAWVYLVTQHPLPQEAATALTAPPPDADAGDDGVLKTLPTAAALARPLRGSRDSSASSAVRLAAAMDAAMRRVAGSRRCSGISPTSPCGRPFPRPGGPCRVVPSRPRTARTPTILRPSISKRTAGHRPLPSRRRRPAGANKPGPWLPLHQGQSVF